MAVDQSVAMAKPRKRQDAATPQEPTPAPTNGHRDRVAARAYELYLARGGTDGADMDDWLNAEREVATGEEPDEQR
jgi:hypothetical protein